jgi:LPXTG-site transpeptidase (sortase) family protein
MKRVLVTAAVTMLALSPFLIFFLPDNSQIWKLPTQLFKRAVAFINQEPTSFGLPVRLKIPKLKVDAAVDLMGVTPGGEMQAPSNPRDVGWFRSGPQPGGKGSAVIDGHFGRWPNGAGSVFDNLSVLTPGDKVYVEDEKGTFTTFIVRESRTYDPKADTAGIFNSADGHAHLNLITCDGARDGTTNSYSQRLVVFTDALLN